MEDHAFRMTWKGNLGSKNKVYIIFQGAFYDGAGSEMFLKRLD